jgi:hypothetical protein
MHVSDALRKQQKGKIGMPAWGKQYIEVHRSTKQYTEVQYKGHATLGREGSGWPFLTALALILCPISAMAPTAVIRSPITRAALQGVPFAALVSVEPGPVRDRWGPAREADRLLADRPTVLRTLFNGPFAVAVVGPAVAFAPPPAAAAPVPCWFCGSPPAAAAEPVAPAGVDTVGEAGGTGPLGARSYGES